MSTIPGSYCLFINVLINLVILVDVFAMTSNQSDASSVAASHPHRTTDQTSTSGNDSASLCPDSCLCDEKNSYVRCVGDEVWDHSLAKLPDTVTRLELRLHNITRIESNCLSDKSNLKELKLQSLGLLEVGDLMLPNLSQLQRLDLSENRLENVTRKLLKGISGQLRSLDLSSNRLTTIEKAFLDCFALQQLNLARNSLKSLSTDTFMGLVSLEYLNLQRNQIEFIQFGSFLHLTHLQRLILAENPIAPETKFHSMSTHLRYMDLSNTSLAVFPHGIDPFVRDLRLVSNQIKWINNEDMANFLYLKQLAMDNNYIESIEEDSLGRLEHLIKLQLRSNRLGLIPKGLPSGLRELYLDGNQIDSVDASGLRGLVNLQLLSLANNRIIIIDHRSFVACKNLVHLDLRANRLVSLAKGVFGELKNLRSLDVSSNPLKHLQDWFFGGRKEMVLKSLQLSRLPEVCANETSRLASLMTENAESIQLEESPFLVNSILVNSHCADDPNLGDGVSRANSNYTSKLLVQLNLKDNGLKRIPFNISQCWPNLRDIMLGGNDWYCDERLIHLVSWLTSTSVRISPDKSSIKCSHPISLQGKPLISLNLTQLSTASGLQRNDDPQSTMDSAQSHSLGEHKFEGILKADSKKSSPNSSASSSDHLRVMLDAGLSTGINQTSLQESEKVFNESHHFEGANKLQLKSHRLIADFKPHSESTKAAVIQDNGTSSSSESASVEDEEESFGQQKTVNLNRREREHVMRGAIMLPTTSSLASSASISSLLPPSHPSSSSSPTSHAVSHLTASNSHLLSHQALKLLSSSQHHVPFRVTKLMLIVSSAILMMALSLVLLIVISSRKIAAESTRVSPTPRTCGLLQGVSYLAPGKEVSFVSLRNPELRPTLVDSLKIELQEFGVDQSPSRHLLQNSDY